MTKMAENKTYLCIDLKSFFASVECVERGLDPLCTNLVVADAALTEKTICLAVSPYRCFLSGPTGFRLAVRLFGRSAIYRRRSSGAGNTRIRLPDVPSAIPPTEPLNKSGGLFPF